MRRCNSSSCVIHFSLFGRVQLWLRAVRSPEDFDLNANIKRSECFRQRQRKCLHSVVRMCRILCSVLRSPKTSKSPRGPDPKPKGRGKGGKGKKGTSSLDEWQTARKIHRLMRRPSRRLQVSLLVLSVGTRGTVNETGKPVKESRNRHEISGNPTEVETLVPMLSRLSWEKESIDD